MNTTEEIESILINSNFETLKEALSDYNINSFDSNGNNILHYYLLSIKKIKIDSKLILDLFISKGIDINKKQIKGKFQRSPLQIAVFSKLKEIFDYLIELNADINSTDADGNNILSTAISRFNFGENGGYFVKSLIDLGADINQDNNHGISGKTWALRYNNGEGPRNYIPVSLLE
ncbi:conserved hypothetical protein [Tenacibaculum maritimum]|uniref:ankyrin repeat domain-containing protein n=1 Tax=Tenacibaculum maritimum TaxID=107401 RepID=UPI0012E5466B|nr:ankyrin repeat domain-containing protein [Tenacibaculum maritimum]CAA0160575.1 conserved hypothetical protein [Tenacibaculum maritimum]CAA0184672.1 conserved hypothetical protein [Tenacibaculum maritimum]CAA0223712.1 conserved hypothetical protein [Tenacibaculum maritimum]